MRSRRGKGWARSIVISLALMSFQKARQEAHTLGRQVSLFLPIIFFFSAICCVSSTDHSAINLEYGFYFLLGRALPFLCLVIAG